jgi:hypothetical protein
VWTLVTTSEKWFKRSTFFTGPSRKNQKKKKWREPQGFFLKVT